STVSALATLASETHAVIAYKVAKGDTLASIARKYSVSVADLRKWNDVHGDTLKVGQLLQVAVSSR
ncbi:MAG: LysM peptidoglycan-binding domain-containing protein, partial [Rhodanobacteraceae bacterium]